MQGPERLSNLPKVTQLESGTETPESEPLPWEGEDVGSGDSSREGNQTSQGLRSRTGACRGPWAGRDTPMARSILSHLLLFEEHSCLHLSPFPPPNPCVCEMKGRSPPKQVV